MNSERRAWSKLYHKSLFDDLRFPVGKLSEDYYIMFKIFDRAQAISYLDTPCYNYLQRNNSITRSAKINHDHEYISAPKWIEKVENSHCSKRATIHYGRNP